MVYRARQEDLDRDVVVKVLLNIDADTTKRRFNRERRAMGRLSHYNGIAPLYGSGFTSSGRPYLLMPFYERGSLQDQLEQSGPLDPGAVRDIGVAVARAIHAAHSNGVLHRDLKPANILMKRSGQPDVADFGIAQLVDDAQGATQALTMTPLYTAPEVFDGVESGVASDVYSVGATLYALLNGSPAYTNADGGASMLSLMRRIHEDPLPALPATVPADLRSVIETAMSKSAADRQASAAALADALAAADVTAPRAKRSPSPLMIGAVVAVLIAAIGGALAAAYLLDGTEGAEGSDTTPEASTSATPTVAATVTPSATSTPVETGDGDSPPPEFDVAAASLAARRGLVRVEAFSCTGVELSTGVLLADGRIVTADDVLFSPWRIDVTAGSETYQAEPLTANVATGLGLIERSGPPSAPSTDPEVAEVVMGDQVAFVGLDGRPAVATVNAAVIAGEPIQVEVIDDGSGNAVEPADVVVTSNGELVGVASVDAGRIEVIPVAQFASLSSLVSPDWGCPSLRRDIDPANSESAVSPAIAELLSMQQLSNAYANEQWPLVRQVEPSKQTYTDEQFINGWRPLRQGFVFPIDRQIDADDGDARWRIALIGHETWNGTDLTTLFCLTWKVDPVSLQVLQLSEDAVAIYGPQPDQPQRTGFVDPAALRTLINENCPL